MNNAEYGDGPGPLHQARVYHVTRRDRFVERVSNWLFNHVATAYYRAFVDELIRRGHLALSAEVLAERPTPNGREGRA